MIIVFDGEHSREVEGEKDWVALSSGSLLILAVFWRENKRLRVLCVEDPDSVDVGRLEKILMGSGDSPATFIYSAYTLASPYHSPKLKVLKKLRALRGSRVRRVSVAPLLATRHLRRLLRRVRGRASVVEYRKKLWKVEIEFLDGVDILDAVSLVQLIMYSSSGIASMPWEEIERRVKELEGELEKSGVLYPPKEEKNKKEKKHRSKREREDFLISLIKQEAEKRKTIRVLEVGANIGRFAEEVCRELGGRAELYLNDVDLKFEKAYRWLKSNVECIKGYTFVNLVNLPHDPDLVFGFLRRDGVPVVFDVVVAEEVVEHLYSEERELFYRAVGMLLGDGGAFILSTPNRSKNRELGIPEGVFRHPDHKVEFTREELTSDLGRVFGGGEYTVDVWEVGVSLIARVRKRGKG